MAGLTDEELDQVLVLFHHQNLGSIPHEFWPVAPRVRHFIQTEKATRQKRAAALEALSGESDA